MTEAFQEFRVSNDASDDPEELRRRIDAEGYLFFRSLQGPDKLRALRRDILGVCREGGWLREGTELTAGIAETAHRCTEGDLEYAQVYQILNMCKVVGFRHMKLRAITKAGG